MLWESNGIIVEGYLQNYLNKAMIHPPHRLRNQYGDGGHVLAAPLSRRHHSACAAAIKKQRLVIERRSTRLPEE